MFVIAALLECNTHLTALFGTPQDYTDKCSHSIHIGYALVATDMATDLVTLLIPIPPVVRLRVDTRAKLLILLTFLVAAL